MLLCGAWIVATSETTAQEVLLDQKTEAGGLKLYPVYGDARKFYYMPDKVTIPRGEDGKPRFSFVKFVRNVPGTGAGGTQEAQGGGLVTLLVHFEVDEATLQKAEAELQSSVRGAEIVGPLTYRNGTFGLVSNFQQEDGDWTTRLLGLGKAPVMEGHAAALSIRLTPEGATLLWELFKQAASDISVSFEMEVAGYRNPVEATLLADWSKIAKNKTIAAGLKTTWMGFDIQQAMKELREEEAIVLEQKGEDAQLEKLWNMAYGKIVDQMFEQTSDPIVQQTLQDDPDLYSNFEKAAEFNRAERTRVARENRAELQREARERRELLQAARELPLLDLLLDEVEAEPGSSGTGDAGQQADGPSAPKTRLPRITPADLQRPPSFSLLASYRQKTYKKTGSYFLNFKKWTSGTQIVAFDENIGNFGKRMFDDPKHFRIVNLDDPAYKQREVLVSLDGQDSADFEKFVNYVTVSMRKRHQDGSVTNQELKIDKRNFNQSSNNFQMVYGYKGDRDRDKWLEFDYKTAWSLHGGVLKESAWRTSNDFVIPVTPPHLYRELTVEADPEVFRQRGVRLATVTFHHGLFGYDRTEQVTLRPSTNGLTSKTIVYAHEPGDYGYEYEVVWRFRDGEQITSGLRTSTEGTIFADELPQVAVGGQP